jgi:hypothetical protein
VNEENLETWLREMETTDKPQVDGFLCRATDDDKDVLGYCCLGLGAELVPGINIITVGENEDGYCGSKFFGETAEDALAPVEFIDWLGIDRSDAEDKSSYDIALDFPDEMHTIDGNEARYNLTAAGMNDAGFTFPQIAQMIRYFGIAEVE